MPRKHLTTLRPYWRAARAAVTRRHALMGISAAVAGSLVATRAQAQGSGTCILTADSGEGPFYFDPALLRSDLTPDMAGLPIDIEMQIMRSTDCALLADARVDLWQADALGLYSGYENQQGVGGIPIAPAVGQSYLRGTQITDASGSVRFRTIYPSWYGGRTPHIHFKIFIGENEVIASQIFFPDEINQEVFTQHEPYRQHADKRTGFNHNDMFLQDEVGGAFADVATTQGSYSGRAVIVVATS